MKIRNLIFGISVIILLTLTGCASDKSIENNPANYKEINGDIDFTISKEKGFLKNIYYLNLKTEQVFSCCNNKINSEIKIKDNQIIVELKNIVFPGLCLTAVGPATSQEKLGSLEGTYQLILKYPDREEIHEVVFPRIPMSPFFHSLQLHNY